MNDAHVMFLMGVIAGGLGGYALALIINYVEYWRAHRQPVELDDSLDQIRSWQTSDMYDRRWPR